MHGQMAGRKAGVMIAPMQRAVNAGALALIDAGPHRTVDDVARIVITAAYPHLFQTLSKENHELKAEIARLKELLSPTQ